MTLSEMKIITSAPAVAAINTLDPTASKWWNRARAAAPAPKMKADVSKTYRADRFALARSR